MTDKPESDPLLSHGALVGTLFRDVSDAIVVADAERRIALLNPAFERIFGYASDEVLGQRTVFLYESPEEYERQGGLRFHTQSSAVSSSYRVNYRRKDGEIFPAETVGGVLRDETGALVGYLGIIRDISDWLSAQKDAAAARLQLEDAIESLQEGFGLFDSEDRLVLCNRKFKSLYPAACDVMKTGNTFEQIMRDAMARNQYELGGEDPETWIERRLRNHRDPPRSPTEQQLSDGRWILQSERRTSAGGTVGTRIDVTSSKRLDQLLRRLVQITSSGRMQDTSGHIEAVLDLGRSYFDLPVALVCGVEGEAIEVLTAVSPGGRLESGQRFDLATTYCSLALQSDGPFALQDGRVASPLPGGKGNAWPARAYLGARLRIDGQLFGVVSFSGPLPRDSAFTEVETGVMSLLTQWIGNQMARQRDLARLERAKQELLRLATTDELTGIHNRRELMRLGSAEFERWRRYGRPFSVLMIDMDHFKEINDGLGHEMGDRALKALSDSLVRLLRASDTLGRLGGDEFVILLPETVGQGANDAAKRIAESARAIAVSEACAAGSITLSIGIAEASPEDKSFEDLLGRADEALYEAKRGGRDRAVTYTSEAAVESGGEAVAAGAG